jgi:hypothetical protein
MRIFNENKTVELTEYDESRGYLKEDVLETEIPKQAAIEKKWHYEVVKEYPNGGKILEEVVDVEGKPYIPAHTEREEILVYIPYTEAELKRRKAEDEICELKMKLLQTDYQAIKYAEGMFTLSEYAPIREQRQAWRDRINELESEIGGKA